MTFEESKYNGAFGESIVLNYLTTHDKVKRILDVRRDEKYQKKDIDFLAEDTKGNIFAIEVKTDFSAYKTGNMVYELTSYGNIGCFARTEADIVMYYVCDENTLKGTLYSIYVAQLRKYLERTQNEEKAMGETSTGYLIPIEELQKRKIAYKINMGGNNEK